MTRFNLPTFLEILLLLEGFTLPLHARTALPQQYAILETDAVGPNTMDQLKNLKAVTWWVEAGSKLLVLADLKELAAQIPATLKFEELPVVPQPQNLYLVQLAHEKNLKIANGQVLVIAGRSAIIQTAGGQPEIAAIHKAASASHIKISNFKPNTVLAAQAANTEIMNHKLGWNDGIKAIVEQVDKERWFHDVETLAKYNRYALGTNITQARDWIQSELRKLPNLKVELQEFTVSGKKLQNVVATLTGKTRPHDKLIVGAHYDSISERPSASAPGAEDNGSGTAGLIEMARLLSQHPLDATIIFIAFSGEEEGLYGSYYHAGQLSSADLSAVKALINMDMIGYTAGGATLDCLLETREIGEDLLNTLAQAAQEFTNLNILTTFNAWGSDHVPYLERNIPAVLTIDNDWSEYPQYHHTGDKPELLTKEMGEQILRMNIATIARLGGQN